ncbi:MAG TPA: penicillin acylase family protein, partial [Gemmatimonadales bacterium]|nr:penicillin acylase family protein [Gemmatimonadales bacterium]
MSRRSALLLALACTGCATEAVPGDETSRWEARAHNVSIIRDDWGIPHIRGKSDADAVFGLMYAQAEDDFNRVETNYLNSMGRLAEAEGERAIWRDLRMKLFIDPDTMRARYATSPEWLRDLMDAWADGLNYYLHTHPEVRPRVLARFEPWMALSFSEGSIGGDIERISLRGLEAFYGRRSPAPPADSARPAEPSGSNGFAIAPQNTANRRALLLINPHTSFFFRAEVQVASDEGLNAYGAVTWGQFFVYQGFNERAGWMHTSSGVDNIDEYLERVDSSGPALTYRYGTESRPLRATTITVPFKTDTGMSRRMFTVYRTHHGPVVRDTAGSWVSVRLMEEPVKALTQSYTRTKAKNYQEFRKTMELYTNSSNNTIFADAEGNIAYFHANFVPRRDPTLDWSRPVDGSDPATEWQGLHTIDESPLVVNPPGGWLYNTNNWPYSAAGASSPRQSDFPKYMDENSENARGLHAIRVLTARKDFTLGTLIEAAYDSYLTAFEPLIPALVGAWDRAPAGHPHKASLAEQIRTLREWDLRWSEGSIATTLAIAWGDQMGRTIGNEARRAGVPGDAFIATRATPAQLLGALATASS